jgi:hypothetical protein
VLGRGLICLIMDIPTRNDLLESLERCDICNFLCIDVEEIIDYNSKRYVLRLYGILKNGRKIIIEIIDLDVYFDIRLDNHDENELKNIIDYEKFDIILSYPI